LQTHQEIFFAAEVLSSPTAGYFPVSDGKPHFSIQWIEFLGLRTHQKTCAVVEVRSNLLNKAHG